MTSLPYRNVLIVGAGGGISASVARAFARAGLKVGLAARDTEKLAALSAELAAPAFVADAADRNAVEQLFAAAEASLGPVDVVVFNAAARARGPLTDVDPAEVERALAVSAFGGFLVVQQASRRMIPRGGGAILITGATASVKGFAQSAPFAMAKFALRGLAQSAARELAPQGIHVAHFIIDGAVRSAARPDPAERPDSTLDPDAIAQSYLDVLRQPRSAWSWELELRPWVERF
jgi:NAD(P)-dependent dehydrogenase (short-subunit alcohol dehydrogenase family)